MAVSPDKRFYRIITSFIIALTLLISGCGGSLGTANEDEEGNGGNDTKLPITPTVDDLSIKENEVAFITGRCSRSLSTDYTTHLVTVTVGGAESKTVACVGQDPDATWSVNYPSNVFTEGGYTIVAIAKNNNGNESPPGTGTLIVNPILIGPGNLPATPTVNDINILENQAAVITGTCTRNAGTAFATDIIRITVEGQVDTTACVDDEWGIEYPANTFDTGQKVIEVVAINRNNLEQPSNTARGILSVGDGSGPIVRPPTDAPEKPTISDLAITTLEPAVLSGTCTKNDGTEKETNYVIVIVEGESKKVIKRTACEFANEANGSDFWRVNLGEFEDSVYVTKAIAVNNSGTQSDVAIANLFVSSATVTMLYTLEVNAIQAGGTTNIDVNFVNSRNEPFTSGDVSISFGSRCLASNSAEMLNEAGDTVTVFESDNGRISATYKADGCVGEDEISISGTFNQIPVSLNIPEGEPPFIITVARDQVNQITWVNTVPEQIVAQGSNGNDSAVITFEVKGKTGAKIIGERVVFNLEGVVGDLSLVNPSDTDNEVADISDARGQVSVRVKSGFFPANVTVRASYVDPDDANRRVTGVSNGLSVFRGLTSYGNFSLSIDRYSPLSYERGPTQADPLTITATVHDRYGKPVIDGTVVTFITETTTVSSPETGAIGQIVGDCRTEDGICTVEWQPDGDNNAPDQSEGRGYVTIMAIAKGEENFVDKNSNGVFDDGDDIIDQPEPYLDHKAYWDKIPVTGPGDNVRIKSGLKDTPYVAGEYLWQDTNNNGIRDAGNGQFDGTNCQDSSRCSGNNYIDIAAFVTFHQASRNIHDCQNFSEVEALEENETLSVYPNEILPLSGLIFCDEETWQQIPTGSTIKFIADAGEVVFGENFTILGDDILPYQIGVNFKAGALITNAASLTAEVTVPRGDINGDGDVVYTAGFWPINIKQRPVARPVQPEISQSAFFVRRNGQAPLLSGTCTAEIVVTGTDTPFTVSTDEVQIIIDGQVYYEPCSDPDPKDNVSGTWNHQVANQLTELPGNRNITVASISQPHPELDDPTARYLSSVITGNLTVINSPDEATVNNDVPYTKVDDFVFIQGNCNNDNTTDVEVTVVSNGVALPTSKVICTNSGIWQSQVANVATGQALVRTTAINEEENVSDASLRETESSFDTLISVVDP